MEDSSILIVNGYQKPHHRVLKPPGGETHDIFGTQSLEGGGGLGEENGMARRQPQRSRHLQSNVFDTPTSNGRRSSEEAVANTPRTKNGNANSASRIFGGDDDEDDEQQLRQVPRKIKDYFKSNIFGDDSQAFNNGNVVPSSTPQRRTNAQGGNPITGEGYVNGTATGGEAKENGNVAPTRVRNPPGGHSTKLW